MECLGSSAHTVPALASAGGGAKDVGGVKGLEGGGDGGATKGLPALLRGDAAGGCGLGSAAGLFSGDGAEGGGPGLWERMAVPWVGSFAGRAALCFSSFSRAVSKSCSA